MLSGVASPQQGPSPGIKKLGSWVELAGMLVGVYILLQIAIGMARGVQIVQQVPEYINLLSKGEEIPKEVLIKLAKVVAPYSVALWLIEILISAFMVVLGILLLRTKHGHTTFTVSGLVLIIAYVANTADRAILIGYAAEPEAHYAEILSSIGPLGVVPNLLIALAFIILGAAIYTFAGKQALYSGARTWGIVTLIGGIIMLLSAGLGNIIVAIGLFMAGRKLKGPGILERYMLQMQTESKGDWAQSMPTV